VLTAVLSADRKPYASVYLGLALQINKINKIPELSCFAFYIVIFWAPLIQLVSVYQNMQFHSLNWYVKRHYHITMI